MAGVYIFSEYCRSACLFVCVPRLANVAASWHLGFMTIKTYDERDFVMRSKLCNAICTKIIRSNNHRTYYITLFRKKTIKPVYIQRHHITEQILLPHENPIHHRERGLCYNIVIRSQCINMPHYMYVHRFINSQLILIKITWYALYASRNIREALIFGFCSNNNERNLDPNVCANRPLFCDVNGLFVN